MRYQMPRSGILPDQSSIPTQIAKFEFALDDGTKHLVWLGKATALTWGREPGHIYTVMNFEDDGSRTLVVRWRVSPAGLLQRC